MREETRERVRMVRALGKMDELVWRRTMNVPKKMGPVRAKRSRRIVWRRCGRRQLNPRGREVGPTSRLAATCVAARRRTAKGNDEGPSARRASPRVEQVVNTVVVAIVTRKEETTKGEGPRANQLSRQ